MTNRQLVRAVYRSNIIFSSPALPLKLTASLCKGVRPNSGWSVRTPYTGEWPTTRGFCPAPEHPILKKHEMVIWLFLVMVIWPKWSKRRLIIDDFFFAFQNHFFLRRLFSKNFSDGGAGRRSREKILKFECNLSTDFHQKLRNFTIFFGKSTTLKKNVFLRHGKI